MQADGALVRRRLEPVEREVEIAAREQLEQLVPRALLHARADTELCRERVGELDLEADQARGLDRVRELERRAALRVGAPDQHAACADLRERVGVRGTAGQIAATAIARRRARCATAID